MKYKFYEEKAKKLGKQLLIEKSNFSISNDNTEFLSGGRLVESQGNKYEALAIVKNIPVSRYTENKNGRIYPKDLWEKVFKENSYKGTFALADHPGDDDGSVEKVWGTWQEMEVREDGVYGTLYLIEEKPVRILKSGGRLSTSSVGFGEFKEDGKIVDSASFELERLADIVMNPSQGTFATLENSTIEENTQKNEKNNNIFLNENTNNKLEIVNENKQISKDIKSEDFTKMNKLEILNAKNHVKVALKEARESKNYKNSIDDLEELMIDIPEELNDQKALIKEEISAIKTKMVNEIKEASKSLETKVNEYADLKAKYDTLVKSHSELTENFKKAEAIVNKAGLKESENYKSFKIEEAEAMEKNLKSMSEDIKTFEENKKIMESDIKLMEEDMSAMESDIYKFKKERKLYKEQVKSFETKLRKAEAQIKKLEKILEDEFDYEFEDEPVAIAEPVTGDEVVVDGVVYEPMTEEDENITAKDLPNSGVDYTSVVDSSNGINNAADNSKTQVDTESTPDYDEDKAAEGGVKTPADTQVASTFTEEDETDVVDDLIDNYQITEEDDSEDETEDEKKDDEEIKEADGDGECNKSGKDDEDEMKEEDETENDKDDEDDEEIAEAEDDKEKEDDEDEKMEESYTFSFDNEKKVKMSEKKNVKKSKVQESKKVKVVNDVLDFYKKAIKEKPYLKNFTKEILTSKSLMEAVNKVGSFKSKSSDLIKMKESANKNESTETYKFTF
jgi:hypothetical protein